MAVLEKAKFVPCQSFDLKSTVDVEAKGPNKALTIHEVIERLEIEKQTTLKKQNF